MAVGVLSVMIMSFLTTVSPASASATCSGSTGVNRVETLSNPQSVRGGMAPGTYRVFSDPCVAQARATGLNNIANNQNHCIAFGTVASGAGGVTGITSAIAGTATVSAATAIFAPLTGIAGVFTIGVCVAIQGNLNAMASHIRGAAQACGNLGIVYRFSSRLGPDGANVSSTIDDMRCQNGSGGVGNTPPPVTGLDWGKANNSKLSWGEAPKRANLPTSGGHENVCSGGVTTGATHYVDVQSTSAGVDWVYLSRKLLSRASNASSATYTVATWSKNTGVYEGPKTVTYNCFKPNTPASVSSCSINQTLYYSPPNSARTSYTFLRRSSPSNVAMQSKWNHITGLYEPKTEYYIPCPTKYLTVTGNTTETGTSFQGIPVTKVVSTRQLAPYSTSVPALPPDSTVQLNGVPLPFPPNGPNVCADTFTGGLEAVTATIYSSFPGYPKVVSFGPEFTRGTLKNAFGPTPDYNSAVCNGDVTYTSTVGFTLR